MKNMNQEPNELQTFTVEEFQKDFDNLMERVENGETFIIEHKNKKVLIVPYNEVIEVFKDPIS
jgi:hypothetical protein